MTPPRTKDGKFAKKVENPDCQVATKGYVKCIARKMNKHRHEQYVHDEWTLLSAVVGWIATLFSSAGMGTTVFLSTPLSWYPSTFPLMLFSIAMTVVFIDRYNTAYSKTDSSDADTAPIQKYEPPTCEKKRECDE